MLLTLVLFVTCPRCLQKIAEVKSRQQIAASITLVLDGRFVRGPGRCGYCGKETTVTWVPGMEP